MIAFGELNDFHVVSQAAKYSDVVINLLGKQELTRNYDFYASNVEAVQNIAKVPLLNPNLILLSLGLCADDMLSRLARRPGCPSSFTCQL